MLSQYSASSCVWLWYFFWNACASQPGALANGGQFKMSSLYRFLQSIQNFQKPIVTIEYV
jgi:hypothetical protein